MLLMKTTWIGFLSWLRLACLTMARKEVKTIKDSKSIRVWTFVFLLILILLLSSLIGTTVWAKPGKPSSPETADFEIRTGEGTQDITLNPPNSFLYIENVLGGYWLPPPTKGKAQKEGWGVSLGPEGGDYCGKYIINKEELAKILNGKGVNSELEAYRLSIYHSTQSHQRFGEGDYWHIGIQWEVGTLEIPDPPFVIPHFLILSGNTNTDTEWEGEYDKTTDTWTVCFNNAWFWLYENTESGDLESIWTGQLSFTVKIKRILPD